MSIYDSDETTGTYPAKPALEDDDGVRLDKRGCASGCGWCAFGCCAILLVATVVCALAAWYAWRRLPDWSRSVLVASVQESDLPADQKQRIVAQIDRVVAEYKAGRIGAEQLKDILDRIGKSPLLSRMMAYATCEKYIEPSGLSAEEKVAARMAIQRVARGAFEKRIPMEQIDKLLDFVSTRDAQGERHFQDSVTDDQLRRMVADCQRLADEAQVPPGGFEIDVAAEVERAVNEALTGPAR